MTCPDCNGKGCKRDEVGNRTGCERCESKGEVRES